MHFKIEIHSKGKRLKLRVCLKVELNTSHTETNFIMTDFSFQVMGQAQKSKKRRMQNSGNEKHPLTRAHTHTHTRWVTVCFMGNFYKHNDFFRLNILYILSHSSNPVHNPHKKLSAFLH